MAVPVHRDEARKFLTGVVTVAVGGMATLIGLSVQGGGELPGKDYTYVSAAFNDVGMLKPQHEVSQSGVRIGMVHDITYQAGRAIVTMRLDGDRQVFRDAHAAVANGSALGMKQVQLDPGTPSRGPLGGRVIPVSHTRDSTTLDDVFQVFDVRTRSAVRGFLSELGGGLAGHSSDLHSFLQSSPDLLDHLGDINGTLASRPADLPSLLTSANRLAGRFVHRERQLGVLLKQMDTTFRAVNVAGADPLEETVEAMPATLRQAREGLRSLNRPVWDVASAMETLRPGGQALGASAEDLRGFMREAVLPLQKVPSVSAHATPAEQALTRTFTHARPFVPRLARTMQASKTYLRGLAPYAYDIGRLLSEHDLLSGRYAPARHYFGLMFVKPGAYNASSPDRTVDRRPYPEPGGEAWHDNGAGGGQ